MVELPAELVEAADTDSIALVALQSGDCDPHVHSWAVGPPIDTPSIQVDEEYPLRNDIISVSVGSIIDKDDCGVFNPPCSFPMNQADDGITYISWGDGGAGGQFGQIDFWGDFVAVTDPLQVTHYKTGPNTGVVILSLTVDDIRQATDPATNQIVTTADDPQKIGTKEITVWDVISPVAGRKEYYNSSNPGVCSVLLVATTDVYWEMEGMPNVTQSFTGGADPASPGFFKAGVGLYHGLPAGANDFGMKRVTASRGSRMKSLFIYVFYPATDTNHPIVAGDPAAASQWPNWYYYWRQTSASSGVHSFDTALIYPGITVWDVPTAGWRSFIGLPCYRTSDNPATIIGWDRPWGIDFFAWICRHEEQHVVDLIADWGQANRVVGQEGNQDRDGDFLRSDAEGSKKPGAPHGENDGYDPDIKATFSMDHFNYGSGWNDIEDWCLHRQGSWSNGAADSEDWSQAGKMDKSLPVV